MAISLNNHESRIKALEDKNLSAVTVIQTKTKDKTWAIEYSNGLIINGGQFIEPYNWGKIPFLIPYTDRHLKIAVGNYISEGSRNGAAVWFRFLDNNNFTFGIGDDLNGGGLTSCLIIGLKIYYIFRYNIYSKIILRIISKISHFFTKIFKYGGEIRDGYIC